MLVLVLVAPACDKGDDKPAAAQDAKAGDEAKAPPEPEAKEEPKAEEPEPEEEKFGGEFCSVIVPCYEKHEFAGAFNADVTVDIDPDGKVVAVSYSGGAPKPIEACILETIQPMKLDPYNGKAGRTRCTQNGQLSGGTRMVMADLKYEVREAGDAPPEGEADAKAEGEADAKAEGDAKAEADAKAE
jgi:hypothetical protein